jgi:(E)-4-hydroxy-3-methylbut-2-enyl-diphosphate synthase
VAVSYVADPFAPRRRRTREVRVGEVGVGGANPIRVQSMTTTDTLDTSATVDQCQRMVDAGCEILRITVPSLREAENLAEIVRRLRRRGVSAPLVADIHFTRNAALVAAEHVEKVRINPGNFADRKKFDVRDYTDAEYAEEVERVAERFRPLVQRCGELGRALRIGVNHGSLSDRILNRFGDTPLGMVESALEFLDVCEQEAFGDLVFSMKASNPQVAIQAYRLLAARLEQRAPGEPGYPFHIGVTEAGGGEDGRIKSAIGIGSLLEDGIGDTIRVSLTEDPVEEVPVAATLARSCERRWQQPRDRVSDPGAPFVDDPCAHGRRPTQSLGSAGFEIGGDHPVRVELELGALPDDPKRCAEGLAASLGRLREVACEGVLVDVPDPAAAARLDRFGAALAEAGVEFPLAVRVRAGCAEACAGPAGRLVVPVDGGAVREELVEAARCAARAGVPVEWELRGGTPELAALLDRALAASAASGLEALLVSVDTGLPVHGARLVAARLRARGLAGIPIVLRHRRDPARSDEEALLCAAVDLGAPLCDGIGDAVALAGFGDPGRGLDLAYRILQGARLRTSWTEFISCPSCGRTLFDLEQTTARIRKRTQHLRGVKIAVMGCIVNGPGEMADADFGYVGSGPGVVDLYLGKQRVARKLPEAEADERLVDLIRERGLWLEPG